MTSTTTSINGWMLDGRLIYRLDKNGCNSDEIVVTRSNGSTGGAVLADAASALRDSMCSANTNGAQLGEALRMRDGALGDVQCWINRWSALAEDGRRHAAFLATAKDLARAMLDAGGAVAKDGAAAAMLQCFRELESGAKPALPASPW